MEIIISDKAKQYLEKKNAKTITIDLYIASGCCIEIGEPTVSLGEPKEKIGKFEKFDVDEYTIYLFKGANFKNDIVNIEYKKFLGRESLEAERFMLV